LVALDDPPVLQCFTVTADPSTPAGSPAVPVAVEPVERSPALPAGRPGSLEFRLTDTGGRPVTGLTDVRVLATSSVAHDDARATATPRSDGSYTAELLLPSAGTYEVWVTVPSRGGSLGDLAPLEVEATT